MFSGTAPTTFTIYGAIISAEVIFGVWPIVASLAIKEGFDPFVFVFYRCAGSATLLLAMSYLIEGPEQMKSLFSLGCRAEKCSEKGPEVVLPWRQFLISGALMVTNFLGYLVGVAHTSGTQAALMQPLIPAVACLLGIVTGTENVSTAKLSGVAISVLGAMLVVYVGQEEADHRGNKAGGSFQLGIFALTVGVVSAASYFVLQKQLLRKHPPIFVTSVSTLVATCYLVVITGLYAEEFKFNTWRPWMLTPKREIALAYAIIFTTTISFVLMAWANKVTTPCTITAFSTLQPLITTAIGVFCFHVVPQVHSMIGGSAIIAGLLLTVRAQMAEVAAAEKTPGSEESHLL